MKDNDPVNNPKHYEVAPGVEAIDIIEAALTPEQFKGYCLGNVLKYRLRAGKKDKLQQDIDKANTYSAMMEVEQVEPSRIPRTLDPFVAEYDYSVARPDHGGSVPASAKEYCGPCADCSKCPDPCS